MGILQPHPLPPTAVPTQFQALNQRPGGARQLNAGRSRIPAEPTDSEPGANGTSHDPGGRGHQPGGARERASASSHLQGTRICKSTRASTARLASAQPLDLGPFESRCSEPQPPAGFCAGFSVDVPTSPKNNWDGGYLEREGALDASPAQSLVGPLAAVQSRAGREPRRPSGSRLSLAGCGSKRLGRPSPRSDPICARPAGRLGPSTSGLDGPLFLPSGGGM